MSASTTRNEFTMKIVWYPHVDYDREGHHVEGYLRDINPSSPTFHRERSFDFVTVTGIEDDYGCAVADIWPELSLSKILRTWVRLGVIVLPSNSAIDMHTTVLVASLGHIPEMLDRLGIMVAH